MLSQEFTDLLDEHVVGDQMLLALMRGSQAASGPSAALTITVELGTPGMSLSLSRELRSRVGKEDHTLRTAILDRRVALNGVY